jgi:hypothetical protein
MSASGSELLDDSEDGPGYATSDPATSDSQPADGDESPDGSQSYSESSDVPISAAVRRRGTQHGIPERRPGQRSVQIIDLPTARAADVANAAAGSSRRTPAAAAGGSGAMRPHASSQGVLRVVDGTLRTVAAPAAAGRSAGRQDRGNSGGRGARGGRTGRGGRGGRGIQRFERDSGGSGSDSDAAAGSIAVSFTLSKKGGEVARAVWDKCRQFFRERCWPQSDQVRPCARASGCGQQTAFAHC